MHAGAAGGGDHHEGAVEVDRVLDREGDLLAAAGGERAAEEAEVHHGEDDADALDVAGADDDGLARAELLHGGGGLGGVGALGVGEGEGVGGEDLGAELAERAGVDQEPDALAGGEAVVVAALGADLERGLPLVLEDVGLAGGAHVPEVRQGGLFARFGCLGEPSHGENG